MCRPPLWLLFKSLAQKGWRRWGEVDFTAALQDRNIRMENKCVTMKITGAHLSPVKIQHSLVKLSVCKFCLTCSSHL